MIKVTAVITTHNRLELLKRAVFSVQGQTYDNIELIVVDDHSTDGTFEWCLKNNITVIKSPTKGGNVARNIGILNATGDYIAFLDDDDFWYLDKISKQVRLAQSSGSGVIYCGIRTTEETCNGWNYECIYPNLANTGNVSHKILQEIITVTSALMIDKKLLMEIGLFDENLDFWQEYELCIRLAQKSTFSAVNEILVDYLINKNDKNRLTNKYNSWKKNVKKIHIKHNELYSKLSPLEYLFSKRVVIWDAISRCDNANLKKYLFLNKIKLKLSFASEKLIRIIMNFKNKYETKHKI